MCINIQTELFRIFQDVRDKNYFSSTERYATIELETRDFNPLSRSSSQSIHIKTSPSRKAEVGLNSMCSKNNSEFRKMVVLLQPLNLPELMPQVKHYPLQFTMSTTMKMLPRDENTMSIFQRFHSLIIIESIV